MIHPKKEGTGSDLYETDTIYTAVDENGKTAFVMPVELTDWEVEWKWAVATPTPAGVDWLRGTRRTRSQAMVAAQVHLTGDIKFSQTRDPKTDVRW